MEGDEAGTSSDRNFVRQDSGRGRVIGIRRKTCRDELATVFRAIESLAA